MGQVHLGSARGADRSTYAPPKTVAGAPSANGSGTPEQCTRRVQEHLRAAENECRSVGVL